MSYGGEEPVPLLWEDVDIYPIDAMFRQSAALSSNITGIACVILLVVLSGQTTQGQHPSIRSPERSSFWSMDPHCIESWDPTSTHPIDDIPSFSGIFDESSCNDRIPLENVFDGWNRSRFRSVLQSDLINFYQWDTFRDLILGVAGAGVLANTSLDEEFQYWYREEICSREGALQNPYDIFRRMGDGRILIPLFAATYLGARIFDAYEPSGLLDDFAARTLRGYFVGVPPMLLFQRLLGSSRPGESIHGSRWDPFHDDNGVSGNAFMGAVPWITAAQMSDSMLWKSAFYFCSVLPAWNRIHQDKHYLSQACLGWWTAWLACRAIERTEMQKSSTLLFPIVNSEMMGIGLIFER